VAVRRYLFVRSIPQEAANDRATRDATAESQLMADIGTEQARWTDINARLDELERLLAKK